MEIFGMDGNVFTTIIGHIIGDIVVIGHDGGGGGIDGVTGIQSGIDEEHIIGNLVGDGVLHEEAEE